MKNFVAAAVLTACLALPRDVAASPVTLNVTLKQFGGYSAYVALYLTDPQGKYVDTLWMAGRRSGYYRHMGGWMRATRGQANLDGITGASVGAGQTLTVHADLADALIDAGYTIQADVVSEDMSDSPSDIRVPLTTKDAGHKFRGRAYIGTFSYSLP